MDVIKGSVQEAANAFDAMLAPKDTQPPESEATATPEQEVVETVEDQVTESPELEGTVTPEPETQTYTVKVDGEDVSVPLDELLKGYSRTSYFHKKLSEIDRTKKELEAEFQAVRQERQQFASMLPQLQAELDTGDPEPDWKKLLDEDPIEFVKQEALWRQKKEKRQMLLNQQARLVQAQQIEQQKTLQQRLSQEAERLSTSIPEWKDEKIAQEEKAGIMDYGIQLGYSPEDMAQVYDHRAVILLRKAMLYDKAQTKMKTLKSTVSTVKSSKPGTPPPDRNVGFDKAKKTFDAAPNVKNAAAALERLLSQR
jgi:hypothetical protein